MKITMLGTTGSGKTVYMAAMSDLFFYEGVRGFTIANREATYGSDTFVHRGFDEANTLSHGVFPAGTTNSLVMPLELRYRGERIIDLDWIDYRGGAISELAKGFDNPANAEILAALLASDVVMVFTDAAVLKDFSNMRVARSHIGANDISQMLIMVSRKKHLDIMFLLSKADSSNIDIKTDFPALREKLGQVYSRFFTETNTALSQYPVIPVGAVGIGNVETKSRWKDEPGGGKKLDYTHTIKDIQKIEPYNVASSFARALIMGLESESRNLNTSSAQLAAELEKLQANFGPVRNLIDLLFFSSKRRARIHDLKSQIAAEQDEMKLLRPYRGLLYQIRDDDK